MARTWLMLALALVVVASFTACDEGSDVETLRVSVGDAGCTPSEFQVTPGQRARLLIENDADAAFTMSSDEPELEPIEIEGDDSAEAFIEVPEAPGQYVLRCEREGGTTSEIVLLALTSADFTPVTNPTAEPGQPQTLSVSLVEYTVSPSSITLTTGAYNIIATNVSSDAAHELNVLVLQEDGSYSPIASIPAIPPQQGGTVLVNLTPGVYRLACQISIGEAGSQVDHYLQGMFTDVSVD